MGVVHQAAFLARHFHAEIILLHVVTSVSYPAGLLESGHELTARDLHAEIVKRVQKELDQSLRPELDGIAVKRLVLRGDAAREIAQTARNEKVDLIAMSTHGFGAFYRFLLGSVTAKVLHDSGCPVWTGAHLEEARGQDVSDFDSVYDDIARRYARRLASLTKEGTEGDAMSNRELERYRTILGELLPLERKTAVRLRNEGRINDEVLRKIEHELDLSESRLALS